MAMRRLNYHHLIGLSSRNGTRALSSSVRLPSRDQQLAALRSGKEFDVLVIGGGCTGAGIALDAATRGLSVALVEQEDFSAGTSSRSTKLIHGGVRYLEKAFWNLDKEQYELVKDALRERSFFFRVAPHITSWLPILLPLYKWWQVPYMYIGVKLYDLIAGWPSHRGYLLSPSKAVEHFPILRKKGLKAALVYYDGQQDDARMNIAIALTAAKHGAVITNYTSAEGLIKDESGRVVGVMVRDVLLKDGSDTPAEPFPVRAKTVISAVGPFTDQIRKMDEPSRKDDLVVAASGSHVVMPGYLSSTGMGLLDPKTSDGRVMFFLPWLGHTVVGTTDQPSTVSMRPIAEEEEVEWILKEASKHLDPHVKLRREEVLSVWSGLRPLVRDPKAKRTEELARSHIVHVEPSGLIVIAGGKWTTYREMAEHAVNEAVKQGNLRAGPCVTLNTFIIGGDNYRETFWVELVQQYGLDPSVAQHLSRTYGDQAPAVLAIAEQLHRANGGNKYQLLLDGFPYLQAEVIYAARNEYACTVVDILARRTRLAFLNRAAAKRAIPLVTELLAKELNWSEDRCRIEKEAAIEFLKTMETPAALVKATA